MNRKIITTITAVLLCFCMTGCTLPSFLEDSFLSYFTDDEEQLPPNYPVSYAGITFEQEPMNVVSLSPSVTEILFDIGLASKLVAKSDNCTYPDSSSTIKTVGTYLSPDINKIIELSADLVITPSPLSKSDVAKLETAGVQILTLKNPNNLSEMFSNIYTLFMLLMGDYDGKVQGCDYLQDFYLKLDEPFMKIRTYFAENDVSPLSALILLDYENHAVTANSIESYFFGRLQLLNVAQKFEGWELPEDANLSSDIIICDKDMTTEALSKFKQYKDLKAVENNDVYHIDFDSFNAGSKRMAEELYNLAKAVYPSAFGEIAKPKQPIEDETSETEQVDEAQQATPAE